MLKIEKETESDLNQIEACFNQYAVMILACVTWKDVEKRDVKSLKWCWTIL